MKRIILFVCFTFSICNFVISQEVLKKSVPGTIYFSDKPFGNSSEGSKNTFTSADYIYARLELNNKTLKEAFGLPEDGESSMQNKVDCHLRYRVTIYKDGEQKGDPNFWDFLYVWGKDKSSNSFNFDILPEPAKATSMLSGTVSFNAGIASGPLYHIIDQERFPENGAYKVRVQLFSQTYDAWGKMEEKEKWPVIEEEFSFTFDAKDIKRLKANGESANKLVMENAYRLDKMPDWFYKAGKVTDPKVSNAAITAILKRDIPSKSIIKFVIGESVGPLWVVEKDEYGGIKHRSFSPTINIAYKRDGKCFVGTIRLYEPYEGMGKYGTLTVGYESSSVRPDFWLDCSLIK